MKLSVKDLEFIAHVKQECKRVGVKCILRPAKSIKLEGSSRCSGYFDSENKELVVAMKQKNSLAILVHEYGHLTQWLDKIEIWDRADISLPKMTDWLEGKKIHNIQKHLSVVRDLELDNEKRSVKIIKKWGLSINTEEYTRKANAYVHFYNYLYYSRKWCKPSNTPYNNKKIISLMSSRFNMRYDILHEHIKKVFEKENI